MIRRHPLIASIAGLLLLGWFLIWLTAPGPGLNQQGFERILKGMTESEVLAIIGVPPGDYVTEKVRVDCTSPLSWPKSNLIPIDSFRQQYDDEYSKVKGLKVWYSNSVIILIRFDDDGLVNDGSFHAVVRPHEPFMDKVRRWLLVRK